ncbi:MAG: hypothetical protein JNK49_13125 [Planctomycetes bacterium]|nr:hypothetical protein [Planctomycetota bacterium]
MHRPTPNAALPRAAAALSALLIATENPASAQTPRWLCEPNLVTTADLHLVHDSVRGEPLLFECDVLGAAPRLWGFRQGGWALRRTPNLPPPRKGHAFGFDPVRGVALLFGGASQYYALRTTVLDDTWQYDGVDWRQLQPNTRPAFQTGGWLVHDPANGSMLLCGGTAWFGGLRDYWFDGTDWQVAPPSPFLGHLSSVASDPLRQRIVVLLDRTTPSRVFEFDGTAWTTAGPGPQPHAAGRAIHFDHTLGSIVAQGDSGTTPPYSIRQQWLGGSWSNLPANGAVPRSNQRVLHDPATDTLLHIGGFDNSFNPHRATQFLQAGRWTTLEHSAGWQTFENICYDPRRDLFVAFDAQAREGTAWHRRAFVRHDPPPQGTALLGLAFDVLRSRMVAVGEAGAGNPRVWEHDGQQWLPGTPMPAAAVGYLVWHDRLQRVVSLGATHLHSYDGVSWTAQGSAVPLQGATLAYDPARDRIVLTVVRSQLPWLMAEWDGIAWQTVQPTQSPPYRSSFERQNVPAYDASRNRLVVFGGRDRAPPNTPLQNYIFRDDLWEWDGTGWSQRILPNAPQGREGAACVFDPIAGELLVLGGKREEYNGAGRMFGEVWRITSNQPGAVQVLGPGCGGIPGIHLSVDAPFPGNPRFGIGALGAPPRAPCLFLFAFANASTVVWPGCTSFVPQPEAIAPVSSNDAGYAQARTSIPPAALGLQWSTQVVTLRGGAIELSESVRTRAGL